MGRLDCRRWCLWPWSSCWCSESRISHALIRKKGLNLAQKIPGVKSTLKKIGDKVVRGARGAANKIQQRNTKGQGGGKFNPPNVKPNRSNKNSTAVSKRKNTEIKNPSTALVKNSPKRFSPNRGPNTQQLANRAVVTSGLSELIKPKKSIAETNKKKKDFGLGGTDQIKKPSVRQGPPKGPLKSKPVKKKSRSNISNSSSYDADFTRKNLEKRGLKAKNFMSPKNFGSTTKEKERKIGIAGNFNTGGKMVKRAAGGIVKMRGGGAATRGMNFNRGR